MNGNDGVCCLHKNHALTDLSGSIDPLAKKGMMQFLRGERMLNESTYETVSKEVEEFEAEEAERIAREEEAERERKRKEEEEARRAKEEEEEAERQEKGRLTHSTLKVRL